MKTQLWLVGALSLLGCTDTHNFYTVVPDFAGTAQPDLSPATQPCTPMDVECVGMTSWRECHADGTWGTDLTCPLGSICDQGVCETDPSSLPCNPGDGTCLNGMAYTCRASGVGFDVTTCPTNTQCVGAGQCVGACGAVGSAFCPNDPTQIVTCDGNTFTFSACPPPGSDGRPNLCVTVGDSAACMPSDCNPATDCDVCGSPTVSTVDPTTTTSTCTETASGFRWLTSSCDVPQTCDPTGGAICGAGCSSICTPGAKRCTAANAVQTCGDDGTWGAPTRCNDAAGESCVTLNGAVVCADPVCTVAASTTAVTGACVLVGSKTQIRLCDATGHLGEPTDCASGLCHGTHSKTDDGLQPGTCNIECNSGESQCEPTLFSAIQTCSNGVWGAPATCVPDGGAQCWDFLDGSAQRHAVCALCAPGSHRCTNGSGVQGTDTAAIETCAADGKSWSAPVTCAVGHCLDDGSDDPFCVADCLPNTKICLGTPVASPSPLPLGTSIAVTCTADGHIPAAPTCPGDPACCAAGASCRADQAGNSLGCVVCVGGSNEAGLTDTRCSNAAGTAEQDNGAAVQVCKPDSTGWQAPQICGNPTFTCHDAVQSVPAFCGSP